MTVTSNLLVLVLCTIFFLILDFMFLRDGKAVDPHDCKYHCEWQLAQMNETFKTLITVCEEKLQKLHSSDLNMAIIREQLQKEFLELFLYELQTFSQRLHDSTKIDPAPQFCLEYCTAMDTARHRECKENVTNNNYHIQMLLQRQRWLRIHMRRRLQLADANSIEPGTLNMCWSHNVAIVIALIALFIMVFRPTGSKFATLKGEKEETQLLVTRDQSQMQAESLVTQEEDAEEPLLDIDNPCFKLTASDIEIILRLVERNSILESWNEELLKSERLLKSKVAELYSENVVLTQECEEKLAVKDDMFQNTHVEANSLQQVDSRLKDMRLDFEARVRQLQSKLEKQVVEDLCILRKEHKKLCESQELANGKIVQLERRLVCQELIQSSNSDQMNKRASHIDPRQQFLGQSSSVK